jgi:LacI family transcriptional regulator
MHVTLQDVARLAGVSTKTVSRVVNDQGEISETTRQHVQAAIDQLGYRPNILARSLVNRRTCTLGVVAWGIDYFGPSQTLVGVEREADELGYSLFLNLLVRPDEPNVDRVLDILIARQVDGIVWAVPEVGANRSWVSPAQLAELPPIVFLSMQPQPALSVVAVDNRLGGRLATQHLIDQGRRQIGLITGPLSWWEARERHAGWAEALKQSGLRLSPSLVVEGDWTAASGERGLRTLLAQEPDIDAVFVSSDQMAVGALGVAHRTGRKIPRDLAIVGFDDTPESAFYWPPLTTIHQHLIDAGCLAVKSLDQIIEAKRKNQGNLKPATRLLQPELVVRTSSIVR